MITAKHEEMIERWFCEECNADRFMAVNVMQVLYDITEWWEETVAKAGMYMTYPDVPGTAEIVEVLQRRGFEVKRGYDTYAKEEVIIGMTLRFPPPADYYEHARPRPKDYAVKWGSRTGNSDRPAANMVALPNRLTERRPQ